MSPPQWPAQHLGSASPASAASPSKTPMSNGSTGEFATNGYPSMTGPALKRFWSSQHVGCGPTIMTARIWPWAASPQSSIWPELHNFSTSADCGNWGDYRCITHKAHAPGLINPDGRHQRHAYTNTLSFPAFVGEQALCNVDALHPFVIDVRVLW